MPKKLPSDVKSRRIQLYLTENMWADLIRLAGSDHPKQMADEIRKGLTFYLQEDPNITGSRKFFDKILRDRFQELETRFEDLAEEQVEERHVLIMLVYTILFTAGLSSYEAVRNSDPYRDWPGDSRRDFMLEMIDEGMRLASASENISKLKEHLRNVRTLFAHHLTEDYL